jgi:hypothetical protein
MPSVMGQRKDENSDGGECKERFAMCDRTMTQGQTPHSRIVMWTIWHVVARVTFGRQG